MRTSNSIENQLPEADTKKIKAALCKAAVRGQLQPGMAEVLKREFLSIQNDSLTSGSVGTTACSTGQK